MDSGNKTAIELLEDLRAHRMTAIELLEQTIQRAEYVAETYNPFSVKLYDRAREAAAKADELLAQGLGGPLCGLPITIKESQWLAGVPVTSASRTEKDVIPQETSAAVQRLEEAGAVIFAKTTCPEYCLTGTTSSELFGTTTNPWNRERTCGGSSGGAGTAVAAGAGTLSLGGDGGGSIRIPAAFCGIVGFKPSYKAVPREPCNPSWSTIVSYGPMARTVADARLMYSVIAANNDEHAYIDSLNAHTLQPLSLAGQKVIISEDLGHAPIDDDVRMTFRWVVAQLKEAGAEVVYDNPHLPSSVIAWATSAMYDTWSFQKDKDQPLKGLEQGTLDSMTFGASITEEEFDAAEDHREAIHTAYQAMFERNNCTTFITPTLGVEAFKHSLRHPKYVGSTRITYPWLDWATFMYDANLTGMPACAMPMGLGDEGLPLSIQIQGPRGTDASVLNIAEQLEKVIGWDNSPKDSAAEPKADSNPDEDDSKGIINQMKRARARLAQLRGTVSK
ncbi:amidase [Amphritea japonica]|uniref:Aspartyl-tRNA(Asn)/glutamyl-tRNA (Gln) amidotransferase subunit A n=1 Tax=Amphritea japonica ATCC BAA-1530 TaxID=1278309 RepID=A0A7R6PDI1_9GAMM|nr:amidase [Amphritea japonica]BBB27066.1 aspartyl-tRNA(Asn)/glutamyl-tRNA (Gln) amidotransferase subunit A [Amphritea japonica ATCC BAA-1530]